MTQKKPLTTKQLRRRVALLRTIMNLAAGRMLDMENTVGTVTWFDTEKGRVRVLTYGFENPSVKPLLVNIHGSGFSIGSAAMDDPFMMQFVEKCDVKIISIDYTLAPEGQFPLALEECRAVIQYAKEHARELKVDPDRIVVMGHSSGGNLCAAIGLMESGTSPLGLKGIALSFPHLDLSTDIADKPRPKGSLPLWAGRVFFESYCDPQERTNPLASPSLAKEDMLDRFPPTLLIAAGGDALALEADHFKDTLLRAGVNVTFKCFEGMPHGFMIITEKQGKKKPETYRQALLAWQMAIDFVNENI